MKTLVLWLAALSLALFAWQFVPLEHLRGDSARQAARPINFGALHAQARDALRRLREKHEQSLAPEHEAYVQLAYVSPPPTN
jgi:hypothetical protein